MNGWDFSIFWQAGRAVLLHQDPYLVQNFYYPLPFAYLMAPLALLPQWPAFYLWLGINLALLFSLLRRRALYWLLYVPVLHQLSSGQIELLLWGMAQALQTGWKSAMIGALMTLKPQAALVYLPWHMVQWWRSEKRTFGWWLLFTLLLWSLPLLWRPDWLIRWLEATQGVNIASASNSPGLFSLLSVAPRAWPVIALLGLGIFLWGLGQGEQISRACALLGSPLGLFYSTMPLLDCAPARWMVPASLAAAGLSLWVKNFIPFASLPILVILWHLTLKRQTE